MENRKLCECGSLGDWEQVGSIWICTECRNKDVKKKMDEFKELLDKLDIAAESLHMLKIETTSIKELLKRLEVEINKIEV